MKILAIDPATTSGWALWDDAVLVAWGEIPRRKGETDLDVHAYYRLLRAHGSPDGVASETGVMVIEEQFAHGESEGFYGLVRIVEARASWEAFARVLGWRVERVAVPTWKSVLGLLSGRKRGAGKAEGRKEQKRRSVDLARELAGERPVRGDNASDAILIGRWAVLSLDIRTAVLKAQKVVSGRRARVQPLPVSGLLDLGEK